MKRKIIFTMLVGLFALIGCGNQEDIPSFSLFEIHRPATVEGDTTNYTVSGEERKVTVVVSQISLTKSDPIPPAEYSVERAEVTDDQIILEFNDETLVFERLSSTIAENSEGVQYQYRSHD